MFQYSPTPRSLEGKSIAITGASDGIGKECARTFARLGASLVLFGRQQNKLEELYDELEADCPGQATIQPLDFSSAGADDYQAVGESLINNYLRLDGLMHCAGLLGARTPIEFYPAEDWQKVMQVNINGPFMLTKALLPALRESSDARLLFFSSSVGRVGRAYWGAYSASKFALEGLMQVLADEVQSTTNIRVNSFNPGATRTAMRAQAYPAENPESVAEASSLMPVICYLLSAEAAAIHGQAIDARDFDPGNYLPASATADSE